MRVLITGATSPIGRLLAARFSLTGQVVALSRGGALPDCSVAIGDLRDAASVRAAAAGCQAILHCAVPAGSGAGEVLAAAPGALLAAMDRERIRRLVIVASGAAWAAPGGPTPWGRAARASAEGLLAEAAGRGAHAVCLAHGLTGGLARALRTSPERLPDEAIALTSPRDLAGAVEGALWRGRSGGCYALVGHRVGLRQVPGLLRRLGSPAADGPGLEGWLERGLLPALERDPRAEAELGWWARSLERTLRDVL